MAKMIFWTVTLNGCYLDSVPFVESCDEWYVLNSLVNHDGYPSGIKVRRER